MRKPFETRFVRSVHHFSVSNVSRRRRRRGGRGKEVAISCNSYLYIVRT